MKQTNNPRRGRGRPPQKKNNSRHSAGNRSEQKVRGNPKQHLEKYKTLAREASQAGDRIQAENYWQFADHYQRLTNEMQPKEQDADRRPQPAVEERTAPQRGHHIAEKQAKEPATDMEADAKPVDEGAIEDAANATTEKRRDTPPAPRRGRGRPRKTVVKAEGVDEDTKGSERAASGTETATTSA